MKTKFIPQVEAVYDRPCTHWGKPMMRCEQRDFPNVIHAMEFFGIPLRHLKYYRQNDNYLAYRSATTRSGVKVQCLEINSL